MRFLFGDCIVDEDTRQLLKGARETHLSPKAFELLTLLLRARPRAVSKTELHTRLWPDTFVSEANLAMLVAEVRRAIGDSARTPQFLRTVQRHGYAFHGNASESGAAEASMPARTLKYWILAPLRQFPLAPGANLVGRDPAARVWLDVAGVSRQHARITIDDDRITLEDLGSKNGTRLRGQAVSAPVPLANGDEIRFGSVAVTFRVWSDDEMTRTDHGP